jgi:hypothetical protein
MGVAGIKVYLCQNNHKFKVQPQHMLRRGRPRDVCSVCILHSKTPSEMKAERATDQLDRAFAACSDPLPTSELVGIM